MNFKGQAPQRLDAAPADIAARELLDSGDIDCVGFVALSSITRDLPGNPALAGPCAAADTGAVSMDKPVTEPGGLYAIVLAAGESRRFGSTKQLARFRGEPLVARALRLAETVCGSRTLLVAGKDWRRVHAASAPLEGFLVRNDDYAEGIASSIACGVRAVRAQASAVLILLADQPLVDASYVSRLIGAWRDNGERFACSRYGESLGPPSIFPRAAFDELEALEGDRGARPVLDAHAGELTVLDCPAGSADVDTPADLAALGDRV